MSNSMKFYIWSAVWGVFIGAFLGACKIYLVPQPCLFLALDLPLVFLGSVLIGRKYGV